MNRELQSMIAHANHPIQSPLGDEAVGHLLDHALTDHARVLDLGCGAGEWLLRALTARPAVRAEGVDVSKAALDRAATAAADRGVDDRLTLHHQGAEGFTSAEPFDVVLSVGATHVFGGLVNTLEVARKHLAPGGRVVIGDGFWEREPTPEAIEMLGDLEDLATTHDQVVAAGWTPVFGHVSTRQELDAYEWACWGTLATWALDHPDDPDSADALSIAATRRVEWLHSYRSSFGFLTMVLRESGK
ncbi:SAM-dependent methyltransferase [Nonomuraea sp. NPDC050556]|uniref:SAM-dependent methyltransferase n=1 Tax=Nonomuraea sp. NPDC050556 TaxID=3364369 RepID=UPI0037AE0F7A